MVFEDRGPLFDRSTVPFGPSPQPKRQGDKTSPRDVQVGGDHYKKLKIQPGVFCETNKLTHYESNIVKYVCRHRLKDGKTDLLKARHYIDLLIEESYPNEP